MSPGGVGRSAAVGSDPAIDRSARRLLGGIAHVDFRGSEPGNFGFTLSLCLVGNVSRLLRRFR